MHFIRETLKTVAGLDKRCDKSLCIVSFSLFFVVADLFLMSTSVFKKNSLLR